MSAMSMCRINSAKLKRELEKRKLDREAVGIELGYQASYFHNALQRARMSRTAVVGLAKHFDIPAEAYVLPDTTEAAQPVIPSVIEIDYEKLGQVIYDNVYRAVKTAWSE